MSLFAPFNWDHSFIENLPGDPEIENALRQVRGACYSTVYPRVCKSPKLIAYSPEMAQLLGLSPKNCESDEFLRAFSGNFIHADMKPFAMCYGGHQFGAWAGQLGDGRAINLGETLTPRNERWMLQLKGSGLTPYSRSGDGLAVLRSSIREFLCSEAMFHLEIPTTRALSLITTGEQVIRDMFYDGHPQEEPGAIVCRTAQSFTRFGNFEILAANQDKETLGRLIKYTIQTSFPNINDNGLDSIIEWYRQVIHRTALMIAHWMRVGFVHGVMNTDNMSIIGLTIDYGPYGWIDNYDPDWTPNTTDASNRRYRFEAQANIAHWNLAQLGNALYMYDSELGKGLQEALNEYPEIYEQYWRVMLAQKLGLKSYQKDIDHPLTKNLFETLTLEETDMTIFFRNLSRVTPALDDNAIDRLLDEAYYSPENVKSENRQRLRLWIKEYLNRIKTQSLDEKTRIQKMNLANPKYVLRNYLTQIAIERAYQGDFKPIQDLFEVIKTPYTEQQGKEEYAKKRPEWARNKPGCSMLSCSS